MRTLYVVDFSNWVYKFKAVYSLSADVDGVIIDTSVLYGLYHSVRDNVFNDIVFCLDGTPSKALSLYPSYKGGRHHVTRDSVYVPLWELVQFLLQVDGKRVRVVCAPDQEADLVISEVVQMALGSLPDSYAFLRMLDTGSIPSVVGDSRLRSLSGFSASPLSFDSVYSSVVISAGDGDLYQLKSRGSVYFDSSCVGGGLDFSMDTPGSVDHVHPSCVAAYKAFFGDVSDNIPAAISGELKSPVLGLIQGFLHIHSQMLLFISACRSDLVSLPFDLPGALVESYREVHSYIRSRGLAEILHRNYSLTYLGFEGIPLALSCGGAGPSADAILSKYKIRF